MGTAGTSVAAVVVGVMMGGGSDGDSVEALEWIVLAERPEGADWTFPGELSHRTPRVANVTPSAAPATSCHFRRMADLGTCSVTGAET